jgi:Peptidase family C25
MTEFWPLRNCRATQPITCFGANALTKFLKVRPVSGPISGPAPASARKSQTPNSEESRPDVFEPSVQLRRPSGQEGVLFDRAVQRLGLTPAARDGVVTESEARKSCGTLGSLMAAAEQSGDPAAIESYRELLSALPDLVPVDKARLASGDLRADYVVVAPRTAHAALQALLKHRQLKRHTVALVDPVDLATAQGAHQATADGVRRLMDDAQRFKPSPRFLLLVGGARPPTQVPTFNVPDSQQGHTFMFAKTAETELKKLNFRLRLNHTFVSDNGFARPDQGGVPTLAVGRFPSSDAKRIEHWSSQVIAHEAKAPDAARANQVVVVDGDPKWGTVLNSAVNAFASAAIDEAADRAYSVRRISFNASEPTSNAMRQLHDAMNAGAFFFEYFGHGSPASMDGLTLDAVASLRPSSPIPFASLFACLTGEFGQGVMVHDSLAEQLVAQSKVLSVVASSDISLPHSNAGLGAALTHQVFEGQGQTVGEVLTDAKREYARAEGTSLGARANSAGEALWNLGNAFSTLGSDNRSHQYLYNLLGDPAMELDRPARLEVSAPARLTVGQQFPLTLELPPGMKDGVVHVVFADSHSANPNPPLDSRVEVTVPLKNGKVSGLVRVPALPSHLLNRPLTLQVLATDDLQVAVGAVPTVVSEH